MALELHHLHTDGPKPLYKKIAVDEYNRLRDENAELREKVAELDVLRYVEENGIRLSPMYSEAGLKRTGCMFCPVPIAHGDWKNIEYARKHHPKIYAAIMERHGLKAMLERLGVEQKDQLQLF